MRLSRDTSRPIWYAYPLLLCYHTLNPGIQSTGIRVELTSTRRAAIHRQVRTLVRSILRICSTANRYTFPAGTKTPRMVVDITNDGQMSSTDPEMDLDPDTARVTG